MLQGKFRSRFNKARKAAKKQIDALASKVGSEKLHELGLEWFPFQFRDLRPKAATGKERATGTAETRRFLGHTTERQTADYVRDKIGEVGEPRCRVATGVDGESTFAKNTEQCLIGRR